MKTIVVPNLCNYILIYSMWHFFSVCISHSFCCTCAKSLGENVDIFHISHIADYDYEDHSSDKVEHAFSDAIDQLALEFSGR